MSGLQVLRNVVNRVPRRVTETIKPAASVAAQQHPVQPVRPAQTPVGGNTVLRPIQSPTPSPSRVPTNAPGGILPQGTRSLQQNATYWDNFMMPTPDLLNQMAPAWRLKLQGAAQDMRTSRDAAIVDARNNQVGQFNAVTAMRAQDLAEQQEAFDQWYKTQSLLQTYMGNGGGYSGYGYGSGDGSGTPGSGEYGPGFFSYNPTAFKYSFANPQDFWSAIQDPKTQQAFQQLFVKKNPVTKEYEFDGVAYEKFMADAKDEYVEYINLGNYDQAWGTQWGLHAYDPVLNGYGQVIDPVAALTGVSDTGGVPPEKPVAATDIVYALNNAGLLDEDDIIDVAHEAGFINTIDETIMAYAEQFEDNSEMWQSAVNWWNSHK